jgi:hypothetical protein
MNPCLEHNSHKITEKDPEKEKLLKIILKVFSCQENIIDILLQSGFSQMEIERYFLNCPNASPTPRMPDLTKIIYLLYLYDDPYERLPKLLDIIINQKI